MDPNIMEIDEGRKGLERSVPFKYLLELSLASKVCLNIHGSHLQIWLYHLKQGGTRHCGSAWYNVPLAGAGRGWYA